MLLTITYTGENACDLGYLLHKNPSRPQTASLSFGKVHVFYPEASADRCTAALLIDINPLDLSRSKPGSISKNLFDYVNDRPYVSSSFMSTAISRVFGTAMSGHCKNKQDLADANLNLSASITMFPCREDTEMLNRVFNPLGYEISWDSFHLDEKFPEWGKGQYVNLKLRGEVRLSDLLKHLYVLIPVFDKQKHYWIGEGEVEKLFTHGEGWLENHPEKHFITRRYFKKIRRFTQLAIERLDHTSDVQNGTEEPETIRLNTLRLNAVFSELKESGAKSVIDMGCGEGHLLQLLLADKNFTSIAGVDVSLSALDRTADRFKDSERLILFQSSICYRDSRFYDYNAAVAVEVIEHLDRDNVSSFTSVIFGDASFKTVIITTPNAEYNRSYPGMEDGSFRHTDHRFEWTRKKFQTWANSVADQYGYDVLFKNIGVIDEVLGSPTQMGIFTKRNRRKEAVI